MKVKVHPTEYACHGDKTIALFCYVNSLRIILKIMWVRKLCIFCTGGVGDERPIPPSLLSAPQVNSSTHLFNKLITFKQHNKQLPPPVHTHPQGNSSDNMQELTHCTKQCKLSSNKQAVVSSTCSDVTTDLESIASTKPLQVCKKS